ncbi:MAG TPA: UV damage endonuclease UvsE [Chloroflexaceae bacterium]|nr:UV damage endonuclease UvsE [Chloroflexaceae bacterium]
MIRLGFAVRAVGRPGLAAGAGRAAHLSLALARLADMLGYLASVGVRYYRAPLALGGPDAFGQLADSAAQLDALAGRLAAEDVRVTVHLPLGLTLAAADEALATEAALTVEATAALLEALDARRPPGPPEGIMVAHMGAPAGDEQAAARFAARYRALSPRARARLALEHEGAGSSLGALLALHQACGVPLVFDALHWELHNPEGLPMGLALGLALATWPPGARPEVHLSSQRSEAHLLPGRAGAPPRVVPPRPGQHADFVAAGDLEGLLLAARGLPPFDLMLEAKAGELALGRLRAELARRAPALAARLA